MSTEVNGSLWTARGGGGSGDDVLPSIKSAFISFKHSEDVSSSINGQKLTAATAVCLSESFIFHSQPPCFSRQQTETVKQRFQPPVKADALPRSSVRPEGTSEFQSAEEAEEVQLGL